MLGQAVGPVASAARTAVPSPPGALAAPASHRFRPAWPTSLVFLAAIILTAALSTASYTVSRNTERRLLQLEVEQTGTVLQVLLPAIETPLSSAAALAGSGGGSAAVFRDYMNSYVGGSQLFVTASLWQMQNGHPKLVTTVGQSSVLAGDRSRAERLLATAQHAAAVSLAGPLPGPDGRYRLGYAFASSGARYVVSAESLLPPGRRVTSQTDSSFADLDVALYLGRKPSAQSLLETNVDRLPVPGQTATVTVPFGASALTLVAATDSPLSGFLAGALWWIVALAGLLLAVAAALVSEWLVRRRRAAEDLTGQVRTLLAEQQGIAQTLQRALLPDVLETPAGITARARYVPGADGVEIGGDWYDLVPIDDARVCFVVGDVSGRGLGAGTAMAKLRFATQAYVAEGHPPAQILQRVAGLVDVVRDGHFATVLCGSLDRARGELTFASAGHLPPVLVARGAAQLLEPVVGPPLGADPDARYVPTTIAVPDRALLVAFTDGLVERPGEPLDVALERLRSTLSAAGDLDEAFALLETGYAAAASDDIAILGVQWSS